MKENENQSAQRSDIHTQSPEVSKMFEHAGKAPTRDAFKNVFLGVFHNFSEDGKNHIFNALGLTKPASLESFRTALDAVWSTQKGARKERRTAHRLALAESKHRKLCRDVMRIALQS